MIVYELIGTEDDQVYRDLEIANGTRQYDFLRSIVGAAISLQRSFLSEHILKALNFQAITCLHTNAGEYRPWFVKVGNYEPPEHYRIAALMEDFVNEVNRAWETYDAVVLAAYVLWRLNFIHPFINGNGRTARAASYFILCMKAGAWLPGKTILPELIRRERGRYVQALQAADASKAAGKLDLTALHELLSELLNEQLASANGQNPASPPAQP